MKYCQIHEYLNTLLNTWSIWQKISNVVFLLGLQIIIIIIYIGRLTHQWYFNQNTCTKSFRFYFCSCTKKFNVLYLLYYKYLQYNL